MKQRVKQEGRSFFLKMEFMRPEWLIKRYVRHKISSSKTNKMSSESDNDIRNPLNQVPSW